MGIAELRLLKERAKLPKEKKQYIIPKKSAKKIAQEKEWAKATKDSDLDDWFDRMRKKMVGTCQCGCGQKSQKNDDTFFRHCICHIFPKRIFVSISTNDLNWVERTFWGGHHTNFDEQGMDKWPLMADWDDIKERFHELAPLLTEEERATKFYSIFEKLIYSN